MLQKFLLAAVVSIVALSTSSSFAVNNPAGPAADPSGYMSSDPPAAPAPRTYRSAQGTLDIDKLEIILTKKFDVPIRVLSIRWTANPIAYLAYAGGTVVNWWDPTEGPSGEYTLTIQNSDSHVAKCTLNLRDVEEKVSVWNCYSKTANISNYISFKYEEVGLPQAPPKPKF